MAKVFRKYGLVKSWRTEYRVLGVTTIKGRQAYGRWLDTDASTHVSEREVIHYFDSEAGARAAVARIEAAAEAHRPLVRDAQEALNAAEQARRIAIKAAAVKKDHDQ